jgi:hypothetical protein
MQDAYLEANWSLVNASFTCGTVMIPTCRDHDGRRDQTWDLLPINACVLLCWFLSRCHLSERNDLLLLESTVLELRKHHMTHMYRIRYVAKPGEVSIVYCVCYF